ncbi:MAG TPA: cytochrome c3 family protein [candidate division Zixibacteria bacterium]|nr:cytochrome c3 family protein [candidate division Zixibacteria bacterium]
MTDANGHRARFQRLMIPLLVLLSAGLFAVGRTQDTQVDDETCLTCHEGFDAHLRITAHRLRSETDKPAADLACARCHRGAAAHVDDPSVQTIVNPATAPAAVQTEICSACHQPHTASGQAGIDPHAGLNLACTDCHSIHAGTPALLIDDRAAFCGKCHVAQVNDFRHRSNHPLTDQMVTCLSCHDFTLSGETMYGHGASAACYRCHPQESEPHPFPHEAVNSFSTEGDGGCVACHRPHGSPNDRLLVQTGNHLCFQCHALPAAHRTAHEGIGARFQCLECHTQVHGSYSTRSLLDPNLGADLPDGPETCYCHGVE